MLRENKKKIIPTFAQGTVPQSLFNYDILHETLSHFYFDNTV